MRDVCAGQNTVCGQADRIWPHMRDLAAPISLPESDTTEVAERRRGHSRIRACAHGSGDGIARTEMSDTMLDLPTVRSGSHWVRSSLVAGQVAYPAGTRPPSRFLKGPRDSRAMISLNGEHTGLLNSACSRP
jgi:hypothetical protein